MVPFLPVHAARSWLKPLGWLFGASACLAAWCSCATAEAPLPPMASDADLAGEQHADMPTCRSGLRLTAVLHDPGRAERSYAVFGVGSEQRPRVVRRGTRIAGYELASIEQSAVVLSAETGRCSMRLQGAVAERELRTIAVSTVRSRLRARKAAQASTERAIRGEIVARRDE